MFFAKCENINLQSTSCPSYLTVVKRKFTLSYRSLLAISKDKFRNDSMKLLGVVFSLFLKEEQRGPLHKCQGHLRRWGFHDVASKDARGEEPPWCHLANWWWWCWWKHTSQGHSWRLVNMLPSGLWTGECDEWQCPVGCQGQDVDWSERGCQAGPFPYWGSNRWCSHSPGGAIACIAAGLACLPGSGRWIPGACSLIQW